jgi:hypothetical protein
MFLRPLDSEQEEIEVHFNSCTGATFTVHKDLLAQICDAKNQKTPSTSPFLPKSANRRDYVDIELTVDRRHKINWDYHTEDPDHGIVLLEVIDADKAIVNPLEQLRRDVVAVFEKKLRPLQRAKEKK